MYIIYVTGGNTYINKYIHLAQTQFSSIKSVKTFSETQALTVLLSQIETSPPPFVHLYIKYINNGIFIGTASTIARKRHYSDNTTINFPNRLKEISFIINHNITSLNLSYHIRNCGIGFLYLILDIKVYNVHARTPDKNN